MIHDTLIYKFKYSKTLFHKKKKNSTYKFGTKLKKKKNPISYFFFFLSLSNFLVSRIK